MPAFFHLPLKGQGGQVLSFRSCSRCIFYYKSYTLDLVSGKTKKSSLCNLERRLKKITITEQPLKPQVWHFFFEWGYFYHGLDHLIRENDLLAIEMQFDRVVKKDLKKAYFSLKDFSYPAFKEYEKKFFAVKDRLLQGDCYQVNLTFPFETKFEGEFEGVLKNLWGFHSNIGAYAHGTFFPSLKKSFISQSPECLFTIKRKGRGYSLQTMPIKGSVALGHQGHWRKKWEGLSRNKKETAELAMITDLLRNDLNQIETPCARVIKKRAPLIVPGILHQYALIERFCSGNISLHQIMKPLFPGGSVTGPPKKRVLEIINSLEQEQRGLYCGTTVIKHGHLFCGNINIRTANLDHQSNQLKYFSGGGVTLLSEARSEYEEMLLKLESFRMACIIKRYPNKFF